MILCSYEFLTLEILGLFNKIAMIGSIPSVWKTARIKPIHKKGDKGEVSNYRPITNLNSISKIFERCILNRINRYGEVDGINQHGFRAGHSTITAAIDLQAAIAEEFDKDNKCLLYSMNLSAAFDLI
jgi:hypothetical protein